MTIINPNSISGISSITALNSTAAINLFKADGTSANIIAGVTTGANFITGTSNVHSTGYECTNINASGIITATNVNVGDDLDVTDDLTIGGELGMIGSFDNNKYFDARIGSSNKLIFRSASGGGGNLVTMLQLGVSGSSLVGSLTLADSTDSSSAAGPEFTLNRNSSSPADADYLGQIKFAGRSDAAVQRNYAKITGKILDASNGTEDGIIEFSHIKAGSQVITGRWRSDSLQLLNGTALTVAGTTTHNDHVSIAADNKQLKIGASSDFILYHDGTSTIMTNNMGGTSGNLVIQPKSGEDGIKVIPDGAVELYHDNSLKLSTGNNGINVSGAVALADSGRLYLGSSNDAYLYHDGSNTHFVNGTGNLLFRQAANSDVVIQTNAIDRFRIHEDGVVAIGQSSKSGTVGAGNLDIQGNATNCIIEMGNPFPTYSGGVVPEFRITATNSGHEVKFESVWGGDNLLHPHIAFTGGRTHFYRGTNSDEIARFDANRFWIGTTSGHGQFQVHDGTIVHSKPSGGGTRNYRFVNNNTAAGDYGIQISTTEGGSTYVNHTELKAGGDVHIHDGNLKLASGHGIDFSATGHTGGMSSELLDVYEEGTWTPYIYPLSSNIPVTYSHQSGRYTQIGNVVYWHFKLQVSNITGNRNQSFGINGFPHNNTNSQAQVSGNFYGETWDGEIPTTIKYIGNTNRGQLYYYADAMKYYSSSMLDINVNSSMLMGSGFYYTH